MKKLLVFALFIVGFNFVYGQDGWLKYPADSSATDSVLIKRTTLDYNSQKGKVTLHQDSRIDKMGEFVRSGESSVAGVKVKGYRIVIFFDQDKSMVSQQKANFLARYNGYRAYVDYVAPNYRVRVGNFRTKLEAERLKSDLLIYFPTAVVVEDWVQLPNLEEVE